MTDLSVILISKNQEWNIARLIVSVLENTSSVQSREILLVDSASSDRTVEIASDYPIDILRLRSDQRLTSHAGRYVGCAHSSGNLVLYLDGDMELCNGWLEKALAVMQTRSEVAAAAGPWIDIPLNSLPSDRPDVPFLTDQGLPSSMFTDGSDHLESRPNWRWSHPLGRDQSVLAVGGAAMYRRSVLEEVGSFNPWLYSDGEPELCLRIRHAGYKIVRLGYPIAYHYSDDIEAISTLIARRRRNLWLGIGQNMRHHLGTDLFWPYVMERGYGCLPGLVLAAGFTALIISIASLQWEWFGSWMAIAVAAVLAHAYYKRSLYRTIYSLLQRLIIIDGTLRGFFLPEQDPSRYPARVDVIRRAGRGMAQSE